MVHHTETEPCLMGNVNEAVSVSSPEEEYLWEDLTTKILLTAQQSSYKSAFFPCCQDFAFRMTSQPHEPTLTFHSLRHATCCHKNRGTPSACWKNQSQIPAKVLVAPRSCLPHPQAPGSAGGGWETRIPSTTHGTRPNLETEEASNLSYRQLRRQ